MGSTRKTVCRLLFGMTLPFTGLAIVYVQTAADDSSGGRSRQPDLEVFNRSVQIIIKKEGDSWTESDVDTGVSN